MRDYGNMPELSWTEAQALQKAQLQIKRLEPLILNLPDSADLQLDPERFHCREHKDDGLVVTCDPRATMAELAQRNGLPELAELGEYIDRFDMTVDVDPGHHRIIIHT